jgi:hypothetical protein
LCQESDRDCRQSAWADGEAWWDAGKSFPLLVSQPRKHSHLVAAGDARMVDRSVPQWAVREQGEPEVQGADRQLEERRGAQPVWVRPEQMSLELQEQA